MACTFVVCTLLGCSHAPDSIKVFWPGNQVFPWSMFCLSEYESKAKTLKISPDEAYKIASGWAVSNGNRRVIWIGLPPLIVGDCYVFTRPRKSWNSDVLLDGYFLNGITSNLEYRATAIRLRGGQKTICPKDLSKICDLCVTNKVTEEP